MARRPDLDPLTQAALIGAVAVAVLALLVRTLVALHRQYAGVPHRYPDSWTDAHIRLFAQLRIAIGIALAATWVSLAAAAPHMPQSWPFGRTEMLLTLVVLLLSYAWIVLLTPRDWAQTVLGKLRFDRAIGVLVVWWVLLLGTALVTIMNAASAPSFIVLQGAYA